MSATILLLDINVIIGLATVILGGGLLFGLAAYKKAKPEMAKITVEIAGQAVVVQKGVIDSLQNELIRQAGELRTLEIAHKELKKEHQQCLRENAEFRDTITDLQEQMSQHSERIESIEKKGEN